MKKRKKIPRYQRPNRIEADLTQQAPNNSWSPPTYYEDRTFICVDCGSKETWTATQQKWWYEVAKGSIYAGAVRCAECRKKLRENHRGTPRRSHQDRNNQ